MVSIEAVVEFDYIAQEPDELSIKKGDKLTNIKVQPGGWWEGLLVRENRMGMFPDNFVKVLGDAANNEQVVMRKKPGRKCKVLFSYSPANNDELELHVNDIIDVLSEVEEGWWRGNLNNRIGVFPSNFVEEIVETREASTRILTNTEQTANEVCKSSIVNILPPEVPSSPLPEVEPASNVEVISTASSTLATVPPSLPPKPVKEICKVLYAYDGVNEDELTIREDDYITLLSRDAPDKGWWKGELNGRVGLFPDNFVTVVSVTEEVFQQIKSEKASPNKVTTNRIRDSITKPSETTAALRKSLDLSPIKKEEEKVPSPTINVNKKPPPPIKKPQRSPTLAPTSPNPSKQYMKFSLPFSSSTTSVSVESTPSGGMLPLNESTNNKTQISIPSTPGVEDTPKRLSVSSVASDSSNPTLDTMDGSCVSRNSSYNVTNVSCNSSISNSAINSNYTNMSVESPSNRRTSTGEMSSDGEFDAIEKPQKLTHLTANRARAPRRRPPSANISKEDSIEVTNMVNGVAEGHVVEKIVNKISPTPTVPWVEELKMNQAKKNSAQGKTRVTIGPFNPNSTTSTTNIIETSNSSSITTAISSSSTNITTSSSKSNVGVVFRSQRPSSMFSPDVHTSHTSPSNLVRNNSTSSCNKPPLPSNNSLPSPSNLTSTIPVSNTNISHSTSIIDNGEPLAITTKQWNEVLDKVRKLESIIETQSALINELSKKVKNGQDRQSAMQNEIDKLMEIVTQV